MLDFLKKKNTGAVSYVVDKKLQKEIDAWLKRARLYDVAFGDILLSLGFDPSEKVTIRKSYNNGKNKKYCDYLSLYYGDDENNVIELYSGEKFVNGPIGVFTNKIVLSSYDDKVIYQCYSSLNDETGFCLDSEYDFIKRNLNGGVYTRDFTPYKVNIEVKNRYDDVFSLVFEGAFTTKIDNELELIEYLTKLELPVSIQDVYKKICQISNMEEEKYKKIVITLTNKSGIESKITYSENILSDMRRSYVIRENEHSIGYHSDFYSTGGIFGSDVYDCNEIELVNGDYKIKIKVKKRRSNISDERKLPNEYQLRDYLVNLSLPTSIDELYKKICEVSLGNVDKYNLVEINCFCKDINTDSIILESGNLKLFKMTNGGKIKTINGGVFSYESVDEDTNLVLDISDDSVSVSFNAKFDSTEQMMGDVLAGSLQNGVTEAQEAKVRTKKLVDEIIKK